MRIAFLCFVFFLGITIIGIACSDKTTIVKPSYCVGNCVPCKPLVGCKILVDSLRLELENCGD